MGIAMATRSPAPSESIVPSIIVTVDLGRPVEKEPPTLVGLVYRDMNGDGLFSPGEAVAGVPVLIDYPHQPTRLVTGLGGGFQLPLGVGDTRIVLFPDTEADGFWVAMEPDHNWFDAVIN
jgi:hypothetical protein